MIGNPPGQLPDTRSDKPVREFPRSGRLLKHSDFQRVYELGRRHFAPHLIAFYLGRETSGSRVGFTVSRALGGAVERNRIKRRMREAVRLQRNQLSVSADVVFNPKKSALKTDFAELEKEVAGCFQVISGKLARM